MKHSQCFGIPSLWGSCSETRRSDYIYACFVEVNVQCFIMAVQGTSPRLRTAPEIVLFINNRVSVVMEFSTLQSYRVQSI